MFKRIYIEITNICNLNCNFCPKNSRPKKYMTVHEFNEIISKIKDETNHIYLHVMGEPLLNPNLKDIINSLNATKIKVNLTTNGLLLDKYIDVINQSKNIRKISISVQALEESNVNNYKQELINIIFAIQKLRRNILIEYRFWNHNKNNKTRIMTKIITDYYKLDELYINSLTNNKYHNNIKLNEYSYIMYGQTFSWPINNNIETDGYCQALKSQIAILVDGSVVPCCLDNEGQMVLGNIFNQTLDNIKNSELYQQLLLNFRNNKRITKLCKNCNFNK